ncbi:MAG: M24 family metallopeptidase [Spirochaetota bacterium]
MSNRTTERREKVRAWMSREGIDAAVVDDAEGRRNPALRYLSGMPSDGLLFLFADHPSILVPWDVNLAENLASVEEIIPYGNYERRLERAVAEVIGEVLGPSGPDHPVVEVGGSTPAPLLEKLRRSAPFRFLCREEGIDDFIDTSRMIKDPEEIELYRELARRTDRLIQFMTEESKSGGITSELDLAMLIEGEARKNDGEGTGFDTIVAGPNRSFAIHAHPSFSDAPFLPPEGPGLSLVDFGILLEGYTSDVTVPFLTGRLEPRQERMAGLVEDAYVLAAETAGPGVSTFELARAVTVFFERHDAVMPHSLGHGIGLAAHESPFIRDREDETTLLRPGMVITLEPGLYDPDLGGIRLENDFLITAGGAEPLTTARTVRIRRR